MDADTAVGQPGTPEERLERTRHAIAQQLARRRRRHSAGQAQLRAEARAPAHGLLARARRTAQVWWDRHPVHAALDFARPALEDYARKRPLKLLGIAAGTGAALTLLKSLRLLPMGSVAFALLKWSDFGATAKSLITPPHDPTQP